MSKLPSRRRVWAIAYGLTIVATLPLVLIQKGWSSPVSGQREGVIHLKRGLETVDVDSLLDTNQPDFFLRIEMDKPSGSPTPQASSPAPEAAPRESAASQPRPEASPAAADSEKPVEWHLLDEEEAKAAAQPRPAMTPPPAVSPPAVSPPAATPQPPELAAARTQIVADALYHAPRLAQQGRYQKALEVVDAALGVDEHVAPLHALRGSLCFKLGRERQAEEGWARALELDPRLSDARQALEWIRNRRR